jgi:hypothetical protein
MPQDTDGQVPGSTLPGAQDKFQAELINGRYVAGQPQEPVHIPSFPAPPIDPRKVSEFKNQPGPPSIVDTIIKGRSVYEDECAYRQLTITSLRAIVELSGLHVSEDQVALQERYIRGEITVQECIDEIMRRYRPEVEAEDNTELLDELESKAIIVVIRTRRYLRSHAIS